MVQEGLQNQEGSGSQSYDFEEKISKEKVDRIQESKEEVLMPRGKPKNQLRTLRLGGWTFTTADRKETRKRLKAGWHIQYGPSLGRFKTSDKRRKY